MILLKNANIVNEGKIFVSDLLIENELITKISDNIQIPVDSKIEIIDASGKYLIPGIIDDQVHFREPGLTHKADIASESRAAVAGGITSFMEMPNTNPQTVTQELLEQKYLIASENSLANYSFYMGATNDNLSELLKTDKKNVCGIKVFMGSSTGNMLVDNPKVLEEIFSKSDMLIAVHCEDEQTIKENTEKFKQVYGEKVPISKHPLIRSEEACFKSSSYALNLAKKHGTRLHILHISTAKEAEMFENILPSVEKKITAEVCVHHLWFSDKDYEKYGTKIKWNPAIKTENDRKSLFNAMLNNKLDVIATDHAPHTEHEKSGSYFAAPSGGPLVQHSLLAMLEFYKENEISLEKIVEKMCHAPADIFKVQNRGYIREGYFADLVLLDLDAQTEVKKDNILYKCKWSPFENYVFNSQITNTFVNGNRVYSNGKIIENSVGKRLIFNR